MFEEIDFEKLERMDKTVDSLRKRFGMDSVMRAAFLKQPIDHMSGGISREKRTVNYSKVTPLMLKVQDEDGEIRTVHQIQVLSQEEKMYAGIASMVFDCIITVLEQQIDVKLIYYKDENRWVLVYR